jgi:CheY-like chemotaxis protein
MSDHRHAVLLVEDDHDSRDALQTLLTAHGHEVVCAGDGDEALALVQRGFEPCVILLDLMMPRKSGWQFRDEQLRVPELARIPVILLSGAGALADKAKALGVAEYLDKPVDVDALLAIIDRHCTETAGQVRRGHPTPDG